MVLWYLLGSAGWYHNSGRRHDSELSLWECLVVDIVNMQSLGDGHCRYIISVQVWDGPLEDSDGSYSGFLSDTTPLALLLRSPAGFESHKGTTSHEQTTKKLTYESCCDEAGMRKCSICI